MNIDRKILANSIIDGHRLTLWIWNIWNCNFYNDTDFPIKTQNTIPMNLFHYIPSYSTNALSIIRMQGISSFWEIRLQFPSFVESLSFLYRFPFLCPYGKRSLMLLFYIAKKNCNPYASTVHTARTIANEYIYTIIIHKLFNWYSWNCREKMAC